MSVICDAHKKKVGIELLYNSVHRKFSQLDQMSWREDAGMRNMSQRGWASRPPVEQPRRTGKKRYYGQKSGGQYVAVLFGLQLPLTHTPFNKVIGIFF